MGIGVTPQRLREVRFAEQWRGYRTEEVDEFVERVAETFDALEARLRETSERAAKAEQALSERAGDDSVSRTLVLAQRTADAAVQEGRLEASRLVAEAEERARALLAEAEDRAARQRAELEARAARELEDLLELRRALESDVVLLRSYVRDQRAALVEEMREQLRWLEEGEHLSVPPLSGPWSRTGGGHEAPPPGATTATAGDGLVPSVDELVALASRAEALRRGFPSSVPAAEAAGDSPVVGQWSGAGPEVGIGLDDVRGDGDAPGDHGSVGDGGGAGGLDDAAGVEPAEEADGIAWRSSSPPTEVPDPTSVEASERVGSTASSNPTHEDPFLAELRRAVDDPEPLGPRDDDDGTWAEGAETATDPIVPTRFLRRRGRS